MTLKMTHRTLISLLLLTPASLLATPTSEQTDSTSQSVTRIKHELGGDTYTPTRQMVEHSTDFLSLLKYLAIDNVRVNTVEQTIMTTNGQPVSITLNGMPCTKADALSVLPAEVVEVSFVENHGTRFDADGATATIDITTRQSLGGYAAHVSTWGNFSSFHNARAYVKQNHRQSEFSLYYDGAVENYKQRAVSESTTYTFPGESPLHQDLQGFEMPYKTNRHIVQQAIVYLILANIFLWLR